jgi:hypothetical protein
MCSQPKAVGRVRAKMGLLSFGPTWKQTAVDCAGDLPYQYMAEDKEALTAVVRGLNSRHHSQGPLVPLDCGGASVDPAGYYSRRMSGVLLGKPM